jgi:hypothetical protein
MLTLILTFVFICLLILIVTIWSDQEQRRAAESTLRKPTNRRGAKVVTLSAGAKSDKYGAETEFALIWSRLSVAPLFRSHKNA